MADVEALPPGIATVARRLGVRRRRKTWPVRLVTLAVLFVAAALTVFVSQAERPPVGAIQRGYRGTAQVFVYNPRSMAKLLTANAIPFSVPAVPDEGTKASAVFRNVQVLGDVDSGEFIRLMVNISNWVAPAQGCATCHNVADFADDSLYTKVAARRMLQMVRHINSDWTAHVHQTGVTCYTCHRGQLVPPNVWFEDPGPKQAGGFAQMPAGKNHPSRVGGGSALPLDPLTPFLEGQTDIHVQSTTALPVADRHSIKQTEWTYSLMMFFSRALGVNCEFCHNTRYFGDWSQSTPQRVTAWYGIRMVRNLNDDYLDPLHSVFPPSRWGAAMGDSPKVSCLTCHDGVYKPLFGVSMTKAFPELIRAAPP